MHLEPGDTEGHGDVGHGVGFGEQVLDLPAGLNVPFRNVVFLHFFYDPVWPAFALMDDALSHRFHEFEAAQLVHAHGDEVEHDVISTADGLGDRGGARQDQVLGVAQPHVSAMRETGQAQEGVKVLGLGVDEHPTGKAGAELRDAAGTGRPQHRVVLKAKHLGGAEDGHGVLVVQVDLLRVYSGQVLEHLDHGGVIVPQHIQLQQVVLHGVVFKVGGDDV